MSCNHTKAVQFIVIIRFAKDVMSFFISCTRAYIITISSKWSVDQTYKTYCQIHKHFCQEHEMAYFHTISKNFQQHNEVIWAFSSVHPSLPTFHPTWTDTPKFANVLLSLQTFTPIFAFHSINHRFGNWETALNPIRPQQGVKIA